MAARRVAVAACFLASTQALQEFPVGGQPGRQRAASATARGGRLPPQQPPSLHAPPFLRGFPPYSSSAGMQPPPYNPYNTFAQPAFQPPNPWGYRPPTQPLNAAGSGYNTHAGGTDAQGGGNKEPVRDAAFWDAVHREAAKMAQLIVTQAQQMAWAYVRNNPYAAPQYQYMPQDPENAFFRPPPPPPHQTESNDFFRKEPQPPHETQQPPLESKTNPSKKYPPINGISPESPGNLPRPPPPPPGWMPFGKMQGGGKGDVPDVASMLNNLGGLESLIDKDEIQREVEKAVRAALGGLVAEEEPTVDDKENEEKK
uniref:Uncharacterized protein n=1 Tax=Lotharella oceanica TaxID=641309 RepID=A0A7S2XA34_9EUKA